MTKFINELIGLASCNMLAFVLVAQFTNVGYPVTGVIVATVLSAYLSYHFGTNILSDAKSMVQVYAQTNFKAILGNADGNQYDEGIEPRVEELSKIVRPLLISDEAAQGFQNKIKENLAPFCTNKWKRSLGKIEKNYYCVVYSDTKRLFVGEAAYYGDGKWHIFDTEMTQNEPLTVLAFAELINPEEEDV